MADDSLDGEGFFTDQFALLFETRPRADVAFAQAALEVAEGQSGELKLVRSGATAYGRGTVELTSAAGSAESGGDFTPLSTAVELAPGQTEKTVAVETLADALEEGAETFTGSIASPSGDARLAAPSSVTVTIPANAGRPAGGGGAGGAGTGDQRFGAATLVDLALAATRIRSGPLRVRVTNGNAFAIEGTLSGATVKKLGPRRKPVRLGSRRFRVAGAARATVRLDLPRAV